MNTPQNAEPPDSPDPSLVEYRGRLLQLLQGAHEQYDKALLTLSGGALGLSIALLDKIAPAGNADVTILAFLAWCFWAASIACVLFSFLTSKEALKKAIRQVDAGTIHSEQPGGKHAGLTETLNILSGSLFVVGAMLFSIFVFINF